MWETNFTSTLIRSALVLSWLGCAALADATASTAPSKKATIEFNRDVRPILAENCLACHGPDKNKRKAGLRLDRREEATEKLESGERAVVPGDVGKSRLIHVVTTDDDDDRMPPKKTGKRLSASQVQVLRDWVEQGAEFAEHWAYLSPKRSPVPASTDTSWPRNEIDQFILARLRREGLNPSPETEKQTLIRRATLDLTGLPPTIEEVDAYLADNSSGAYEKVVDRLLASPAFGEKMAEHWLDLARYADSDGYHADVPRSMWQYRDYVIRSFNENKPFDQFTVEQIAGDLLPKPSLDQRIATAFNRNGMSSTEGGADPDEYLNKYVTDRVNTFGTVFLGSSIACTECHDHKYDPFTQREYYQFYDFFNRLDEKGLDSDPAPPFVKVPTTDQTEALAKLTNQVATLEKKRREFLDQTVESLDLAQTAWEEVLRNRAREGWQVLAPEKFSAASGASLQRLADQSILAGGTNAATETYEVRLASTTTSVAALRLEALTDDSLPSKGTSRATNANFILTHLEAEAEVADPSSSPGARPGIEWRNWFAIGPFNAGSKKEVFDKSFIDELHIDLAKKSEEGRPAWQERQNWRDGVAQPLSGENQVTYFYRTFSVPTSRHVMLRWGSDGGIQAWLNGEKLRKGQVFRRVAAAPDEALVWLPAGENQLLLKVHHGTGEYGFLFAESEKPVTKVPVEFAVAAADSSDPSSPPSAAIDDKRETGWKFDNADGGVARNRQAVFALKDPVQFEGGTRLTVRLRFDSDTPQQVIGRFRLAVNGVQGMKEIARLPQKAQSSLFADAGAMTGTQKEALKEFYRDTFSEDGKKLFAQLTETRASVKDLQGKIPTIRVMEDLPEPRVTEIRVRGDYRNKGDKVVAGVPHILPGLPREDRTNRMSLARWLTDPNHPLLSRVTVNRFWASYFGTGLVKTGNEFGSQGELPSHPELLDWLAREFIDGGWNIKAFQKMILMSATYRQSSKPTPELLARDPGNRLLARGPRLRLSAEVIRDCALDYAGLLDRKRQPGGPSVRPYQPAGLWEEKMFGGNKYEESSGADLYRRSLYTLWKRTVLNPTLMTFDAPDRAICTEQRSMTCTPLQAFVTLNEKGFVEAARVFAGRVLREGGTNVNERVNFAWKTVLARLPSAAERKIMTDIYSEMFVTYQKNLRGALDLVSIGEAPRPANLNELELAAWTTVANVLFNLDETITKE